MNNNLFINVIVVVISVVLSNRFHSTFTSSSSPFVVLAFQIRHQHQVTTNNNKRRFHETQAIPQLRHTTSGSTSTTTTRLAYTPFTTGTANSGGAIPSPPVPQQVQLEKDTPRQYFDFMEWCNYYGIVTENGFQITENNNNNNGGIGGDWHVVMAANANQDQWTTTIPSNSRVLFVPATVVLSSQRARIEDFSHLQQQIQHLFLEDNNNDNNNNNMDGDYQQLVGTTASSSSSSSNLIQQFYLFLKILKEYEFGKNQSPYHQWLDALPRKFSTAINMDQFELDCLPPFAAALSKQHRAHYQKFVEILTKLSLSGNGGISDIIISESTKTNSMITKWAFNIVFTRSIQRLDAQQPQAATVGGAAYNDVEESSSWWEIHPMGDMFNHDSNNANVELRYDQQGNCHYVLTRNVEVGEPLTINYGRATNPSRFLAIYGFFDPSPLATFCKFMLPPTFAQTQQQEQQLIHLGYDYERMVFYVNNGGIAEEVWDIMLYTILEKLDPLAQQQFYQAHLAGDTTLKGTIHRAYIMETCKGLLNHVNEMLEELEAAADHMDTGAGIFGDAAHTNLKMIRMHNDFVQDTFQKVKSGVEFIVAMNDVEKAAIFYEKREISRRRITTTTSGYNYGEQGLNNNPPTTSPEKISLIGQQTGFLNNNNNNNSQLPLHPPRHPTNNMSLLAQLRNDVASSQ